MHRILASFDREDDPTFSSSEYDYYIFPMPEGLSSFNRYGPFISGFYELELLTFYRVHTSQMEILRQRTNIRTSVFFPHRLPLSKRGELTNAVADTLLLNCRNRCTCRLGSPSGSPTAAPHSLNSILNPSLGAARPGVP